MAPLSRTESKYAKIRSEVREFAQENISKIGLTFDDFLKQTNHSERTVQRALRAGGSSWKDIVVDERIEEARFFLQYTEMSMTLVSVRCGYKSLSLFDKVFKEQTGKTPREYREAERT